MKAWYLAVAGAVLVGLGALLYFSQNPSKVPTLIDARKPPTIAVEGQTHDLGIIPMEVPAKDTFKLSNVGGETLLIEKVEASCGCTATDLETNSLNPGESTNLQITLDTSLKLGPVSKTIDVFSNDPKTPKLVLELKANVVVPEGKAAGPIKVSDPLKLFHGDCKSCHVDRGIGKAGKDLFIADCGMCHGLNGEGGVSPPLIFLDYEQESTRDYVKRIISNGSLNSPTMPPYAEEKGGPLSETQIESLVKFLAYQHQQYKAGKLKLETRDTHNHAHTAN